MLRNLVCNLFLEEPEDDEQPRRVTTTVPKAKEARRLAERAVTLAKKGTLNARRRALALLQNKRAVKTLFEDIAPLYTDRPGGYTRIVRLTAWRRGDGTDLCYFELVSEPLAERGPAAEEPVAPRRVPTATEQEEPEAPSQDEAAEDAEEKPSAGDQAAREEPGEEPQDEGEEGSAPQAEKEPSH